MSYARSARMLGTAVLAAVAFQLRDIPSEAAAAKETRLKELRVNFTLEIKSVPAKKLFEVSTDVSGKLTLDAARVAALRLVEWHYAGKLPISVAYNVEDRRITSVGSAPTDNVVGLTPADSADDMVKVQLTKRQTVLYLLKSNARFLELFKVLERAYNEKKEVAVGVLPANAVIEDVRIKNWN
jgi:hypothetical protein